MPRKRPQEPIDDVMIRAHRLEREWEPVRRRMQDDQDLFMLDEMPTADGYESVTFAKAWNTVVLTVAMLTADPLRWKRPLKYGEGDKKEIEDRGSQIERALLGIQQEADAKLARIGQYPLHYSLAYFGAVRGWICCQAFHTNKKNGFPFQIAAWDPIEVACEYGDEGIAFLVRTYDERIGVIKKRGKRLGWNIDNLAGGEDDIVKVRDIWTDTQNGLWVNSQNVKPMADHGLTRCPIVMMPVGGSPLVSSTYSPNSVNLRTQLEGRGMSVLYGAAEPIRYLNRMASQIADVFAVYSNPIVVLKTKGGRLVKIDLRRGAVNTLDALSGEDFEIIRPQGMPGDLAAWVGLIQAEIQEATYPSSMYGNAPGPITGVAISILGNAAVLRPMPIDMQIKGCMTEVGSLILEQWERFGGQIEVEGKKGRRFVVESYGPELVGGYHKIQVVHEIWRPQDKAANANIARMLTGSGVPIISVKTANDEYLATQDPEGEAERIREEAIANDPETLKTAASVTGKLRLRKQIGQLVARQILSVQEGNALVRAIGLADPTAPTGQRPQPQQPMPQGMPAMPAEMPQGPMPGASQPGIQGLPPGMMQAGQLPPGMQGMPSSVVPPGLVTGPQSGPSPDEMQLMQLMQQAGMMPPQGG